MSILKILGLIYIVVMLLCFFEAYFYAEFDPESKKLLKEREDNQKN
jgi:hypothetical protein